MNNELDELDELENEEDGSSQLNIDLVKKNLNSYSSNKLCEIIVCDRYFGCYKEIAIICMEELARRRLAGDDYAFEDYIQKSFNELPKLDFSIPDLGDVLRQVANMRANK